MKKISRLICVALSFVMIVLCGCSNQRSVINIEKTSTNGNTDTYTIYYSDNTTGTFEVSNGQKTITDIQKTSSEGKKDIYTIYYSDNTTSQFEVVNGQDGVNGLDGKDGAIITVSDMYNEWKKELSSDADSSFDAFLKTYISVDVNNQSFAVTRALQSAVSIVSVFNYPTKVGTKESDSELTEYQSASAGSGVIYKMSQEDKQNGDCYIITNYHVVYDAKSNDPGSISTDIRVFLYGMEFSRLKKIEAQYLGGSMAQDIAVLRVSGSDILKTSNAIECELAEKEIVLGQDIIAVGNPEGNGFSVTKGICSVENEQIDMTLSDNMTEGTLREIRIDAPVNPGNSGGGLFDMQGRLVGIVNAKLIDSKVDCIGYAIPMLTAKRVADKIIKTCDGDIVRSPKFAKLGLMCASIGYQSYFDTETNSIKYKQYIVVSEVVPSGISATLVEGFEEKDIIVSAKFDGVIYEFERIYDLSNFLLLLDENSVIEINVKRLVIPNDNNPESENYIDVSDKKTYYYPNAEYKDVVVRISYNSNYLS